MPKFNIACVQMNSQNNIDDNLEAAKNLIISAVDKGAVFVTLPENVALMAESRKDLINKTSPEITHKVIDFFQNLAAQYEICLLLGSVAVTHKDKLSNRSFLINDEGKIISTYDKIHLYDANVENGESHRESTSFYPGHKAILAKTPFGTLGMTICYDLRFPALFTMLAKNGAQIITVPSAFTYKTGKDHWECLLRARAIETACFIIAPAQTGHHPANRQTYGHSLIINPWGDILAKADNNPGIIIASIDTNLVSQIRTQLPTLDNASKFTLSSDIKE